VSLPEIELWPRSRFSGRETVLTTAGPDGQLEVTRIAVPDDVILCDFCNAEVASDPVPVLYGSSALCPSCRARVEASLLTEPRD